MKFSHLLVLAAIACGSVGHAESFKYFHKDDATSLQLIVNFFNHHDADFTAIRNGQPLDRRVFATGQTSDENIETLVGALSGYSLRLSSLRITQDDIQSCTEPIAEEVSGKMRWGKQLLDYRLSRRNGLVLQLPEDDCTCTLARYHQEIQAFRQAIREATQEYCDAHKKACAGTTSNVRGTIVSTIPNLVFRSMARISGTKPLNAEELAGLGVRCQEVFNGVTTLVLKKLKQGSDAFACLRWGELVVVNSGRTIGSTLNGNHVLPVLLPFHYIQSPNVRYTPGDRGLGIVTAPNAASPADPTLSAEAGKLLVDFFDPWEAGVQAVGGGDARTHIAGRDIYYLAGIPWNNNKCEERLAKQREVDTQAGEPFDAKCFAHQFPELNGNFGTKDGVAALDREFYCPASNPSTPPYRAQCPDKKKPTPTPTPPQSGGGDPGSCQNGEPDLPACTGSPDFYAYLPQALASATCQGDVKEGGYTFCRYELNGGVFNPCGNFNHSFSLTNNPNDDLTSGYGIFVNGECHDLSSQPIYVCAITTHQYGICQAPPDNGGGGGDTTGGCVGDGCPPLE